MNWCCSKRVLSGVDDSIPVFSLNNYEGYAKITSVYDGDTFKAVIILHGRPLKFNFRTIGYDSAEMKPSLGLRGRADHIHLARLARDMFKEECGFNDRAPYQLWNPFLCRNKVNGLVWIECGKNDKYSLLYYMFSSLSFGRCTGTLSSRAGTLFSFFPKLTT